MSPEGGEVGRLPDRSICIGCSWISLEMVSRLFCLLM